MCDLMKKRFALTWIYWKNIGLVLFRFALVKLLNSPTFHTRLTDHIQRSQDISIFFHHCYFSHQKYALWSPQSTAQNIYPIGLKLCITFDCSLLTDAPKDYWSVKWLGDGLTFPINIFIMMGNVRHLRLLYNQWHLLKVLNTFLWIRCIQSSVISSYKCIIEFAKTCNRMPSFFASLTFVMHL